ncbi:DUF1993 domain-containing protein [Gynuella sunshinyii]|uniref:DUF1993 domain-containing protein n=1 Tax=Gynuella sunshinyii YC6258 TaxID=1445510 RepID=A0A0C5VUF6_9GAMM|nr:DUF1993 domain-containing protein [Gynuella sunshinyii]AJQ96948.1 hypothetical protein YC6258_04916 [Gynuella sunshinyii YC6258]
MTFDCQLPLTAIISRMLTNTIGCLDKARAHAQQHDIEETDLLNARLSADMLPMQQQIEIVTTAVRGTLTRLLAAGPDCAEDPDYAVFNRGVGARFRPPASRFAELISDVTSVRDWLTTLSDSHSTAPPDTITVQMHGQARIFSRPDFIVHYFLPNFYFHLSMAYGILRHYGVALGKQDYEGMPVYQTTLIPS